MTHILQTPTLAIEPPSLLDQIKAFQSEPIQYRSKHYAFIRAHQEYGYLDNQTADDLIRKLAMHDAEELQATDPILARIEGRQRAIADSFGMWDHQQECFRGSCPERLPGMAALNQQWNNRMDELARNIIAAWSGDAL